MKTLSELSQDYWLSTPERFSQAVEMSQALTGAYQAYEDADSQEREAAVLAVQFPGQFLSPEKGDMFAGRVRYPLVGFSPEPVSVGYYCCFDALEAGADAYPSQARACRDLINFWRGRTTVEKTRSGYPQWVAQRLPSDAWQQDSGVAFPLYRMAGTTLDYSRLLQLGLGGLADALEATSFRHVVPLMLATIDRYVRDCSDEGMRQTLLGIGDQAPRCFREAIQLFWLYALHAGTWNYGRLDVALGPFLVADLESGLLDEAEALELLCSLWHLMNAYDNQYDNRLIVGGKGRPQEPSADRFALLAIEATRRVRKNQPQLSLRCYRGQNPELWERAMQAIGEGCTFPMLYNDDVNIPAVARAFGVSEQVAVDYTPFGCGEYVLGSFSVGSPNGVINLLKALEVTLHDGVDAVTGEVVVPTAAKVEHMRSFDDLWSAYDKVVRYYVEALARQQKIEYDVASQEAPFAFISALTADCVDRNKGAFGGGSRYLGGTLETYGNTNTADSLHVIRELVFRQKQFTLHDLIEAIDSDFSGFEPVHLACRKVSKYGNDEAMVDAMACRVHEHICQVTAEQSQAVGLDSYLVVIINNWANTVLGKLTSASVDGRRFGQPMANANNPSPGADTNGVTAFLNSLVKLDPGIHAGAVQNMKFSRAWFSVEMFPKMSALLQAYFDQGGAQAMITVVSREDLEAAMREPERWGHLMVRVGGFSIRFVELPREAQLEILERTLH